MHISPWRLPRERRYKKRAEVLQKEVIDRIYGPGHPGFRGRSAEIEAHITVLVDCVQGLHGRALQIAVTAYGNAQRAKETFGQLTAKKRGRDRAAEAETEADVAQWLAIFKAARQVYLAARAARGECAIDVLPEGCESPDYLAWQTTNAARVPVGTPVKDRWRIPTPEPVTKSKATLIAASVDAVSVARSTADAANVLRLARVNAAPVLRLPEACGIADTGESGESAGQMMVARLERFAASLHVAA